MRLRAFGATIAGLSGPKGGVTRHPMIGIASKGNLDGQAEGTTRHYSRVDGACARETTIRPPGTCFCKSRDRTAQLPLSRRTPHDVIMGWLRPRTGRP